MKQDDLLAAVEKYYSHKVKSLGPTPEGADYNSLEAQEIRFAQFLKLFPKDREFSLNDFGCGYGAMPRYLADSGYRFRYFGFDISEEMLANAARSVPEGAQWEFTSNMAELKPADFTVACAIFNVKLEADTDSWHKYILETLDTIAERSAQGFGFNMLTSYSDKDRMRPDLYYGDPLFFFDYCYKRFSRHIAVLHDYGLYDFTVLVRFG